MRLNRILDLSRLLPVLPLLLALPLTSPTAQEEGDRFSRDQSVTRVYRARNMRVNDAVMMAHQVCQAQPGQRPCEYAIKPNNWFEYFTDADTQMQIAAALEEGDVPPPSYKFRVSLVMADFSDSLAAELPMGEDRAVEDLRHLLPYTGYRLLDSGLILSRDRAQLYLGGNAGFIVQMRFSDSGSSESSSLMVEEFEVHQVELAVTPEKGVTEPITRRLLGTAFAMEIGETVVVGTSKLNGNNEALIVLLTAEH